MVPAAAMRATDMQTVFVTGATGFIGRHVVAGLLARGCAVRCLVRSPDRADHLRRAGVETVPGTLEDVASWSAALAGCDTVIHAGGAVAARRRRDLLAVNGRAVGAVADACGRIETPPVLVHLSSLAAAGPAPAGRARAEAGPLAPVSWYGVSKRDGEAELTARADRLPITVLRPGIVFGQHDTLLAAAFQSIARFRLHVRMGFRDLPLSLIHVTDLVALLLAAADRGERLAAGPALTGQGVYNACDDREHPTYGDLGRRIAAALGRSVLVVPLPGRRASSCRPSGMRAASRASSRPTSSARRRPEAGPPRRPRPATTSASRPGPRSTRGCAKRPRGSGPTTGCEAPRRHGTRRLATP
jgi:nucleoside-diphosphate-sugar epimerase